MNGFLFSSIIRRENNAAISRFEAAWVQFDFIVRATRGTAINVTAKRKIDAAMKAR
jgi:hypothetical protein